MNFISEAAQEMLRQEAPAAEQQGSLTERQLALIYQEKWFRLFVPEALGGLQCPLPEALQLQERLAGIDGSLGWTITLCAGAAWFVAFLDESLAQEIFSSPKVCLGGSGAASGRAVKEGNGYRISGQWRFATGAPHLTHFTANCQLWEGNQPLTRPDGSPLIQSFIFKQEEVQVVDDWRAMGLVATGSHTFRVQDLWVPATRSFIIDAALSRLDHPVYHYPFLQFAEATLGVNYCGMSLQFLALAGNILLSNKNSALHRLHHAATTKILAERERFYKAIEASMRQESSKTEESALMHQVSQACRALVTVCREAVAAVYPYCGMAGADTQTALNRVWRDLHTASQHALLHPLPGH